MKNKLHKNLIWIIILLLAGAALLYGLRDKKEPAPEPALVVQAPVVQAVFPAPKPIPKVIVSPAKPRVKMASREEDQARPAVKKPVAKKPVAVKPTVNESAAKPATITKTESKGNWKSCKVSWYDEGSKTASGERFNPEAMTAAHKSLPFGTKVEVKRGNNTVIVRIIDRGPYIAGRTIDLSRAAFRAIAPLSSGVTTVQYRILGKE